MQTSALFGAKTLDFFKFNGVFTTPHGQGEVEPVQTFCGQGGRDQFFAILCRCLLWMAPW